MKMKRIKKKQMKKRMKFIQMNIQANQKTKALKNRLKKPTQDQKSELKEDIYGRLVNKKGNIVKSEI
jgi:hypothetical protein